jgi:O-antigen/teichoic acid export membrane protein
MSLFRQNVLANYAGRGWAGLMSLVFIPVYISFMGIEAYGLVGFFITLQVVLSLLDMGLSTALNRELARSSAGASDAGEARNLVRTLEIVYFAVAAGIAVTVVFLAPLIAGHWLRSDALPTQTVSSAVQLMGLTLALQWPFALYSGGLMGLQRQVLLNAVTIVMATLRWGGAALVLWRVSPTIEAFFIWQALASALQTIVMGVALWRSLPRAATAARFEKATLLRIWRFAAGMTGISAMAVILTQLDKIILSKLLPLELFGYYTLAALVASSLLLLVTPIFAAAFPNFTQLVAAGDTGSLKTRYHQICQLVSVVVIPAAVVLALFSEEILLIWTRDAVTAGNAHFLVSLLVAGTALNSLMHLPYAIQLAHGWTRFAFIANVIAVALLAPAIIWAATHYGAIGAAIAWVALNGGYVFIGLPIMHRWLLKGELKRWYLADVGLPLFGSLAVALLGRWWLPAQASTLSVVLWLLAISALTLLAAAWATPFLRQRYFRAQASA